MIKNYSKEDLNAFQKIRHVIGWCFYKVGYKLWEIGYKITLKISEEVSENKIENND